ncbi:(2Fe-2S)-binding protein [Actinopolymorpha sp. NPDC004070]|uniref:(2Fe-2S)-binding protein n=1 Tax=Actinopolymorpha sp. NPDC004070 TaxID=3154548 RepID=UPI0033B1CFC4
MVRGETYDERLALIGGEETEDLLADAGTVGAYFTVATDLPRGLPPGPSRGCAPVSLEQLYAGHAALGGAITHTTDRLGTTEVRVGASILFQGMAARLWSPVVAVALLHRRVPVLAPGSTWARLDDSSAAWRTDPARVALLDPDRHHDPDQQFHPQVDEPDADRLALLVVRTVVNTHLTPLVDAVQAEVSLPEALLWGNAASALVGSLGVLARARPGLVHEVSGFTEGALRQPPLADAGILNLVTSSGAGTGMPEFRRRSCCLYYRVPGGGLCGDCALAHRP